MEPPAGDDCALAAVSGDTDVEMARIDAATSATMPTAAPADAFQADGSPSRSSLEGDDVTAVVPTSSSSTFGTILPLTRRQANRMRFECGVRRCLTTIVLLVRLGPAAALGLGERSPSVLLC